MADATYPLGGQGCYEAQGGKSWVVGSTGTLTVEGGGTLAINDSATVTMEGDLTIGTSATLTLSTGATASISGVVTFNSTAAIVLADGSKLAVPKTTQSTTSGTITNFGLTTFGTTILNGYTLAAPDRAGLRKTLIYTIGGASAVNAVITTASTNSYIRNTTAVAGDTHVITFTEAGDWAELISVSTSEWRVLGNSGGTVS